MAHIKGMVISGFKSFAKRTEINFDKGINIIVGPNGSGKSNISDALCFVLGRLSIKSIRAEKASHLLFMGSKFAKPAKEAYVELIFDNGDRAFNLDRDDIILKRIVRRNGQSIYKINDETKTRAEIIETLAQAGIDPHGFNIVLQGGIDSIIKMHPEDRRKIIEEVAGIAIYEHRKEKSLRELERTDERLKEISIILKQRTEYLNNLEEERKQAQRFKELESVVKRSKASILQKKMEEKEKELESVVKSVEAKISEREKLKERTGKIGIESQSLSEKIEKINKYIQEASGVEQSNLREQIANLRAEIEGLKVRKESQENRKEEFEKRIGELERGIPELEEEIRELGEKSPKMAKKSAELKRKKEELALIEEERKRTLSLKTELEGLKERIKDKREQIGKVKAESEGIISYIEQSEKVLKYRNEKECFSETTGAREILKDKKAELEELGKRELENEKIVVVADNEIKRANEVRKHIETIDICPLCQSTMTKEHKGHVFKDVEERIANAEEKRESAMSVLDRVGKSKDEIIGEIINIEEKISLGERESASHKSIEEKKGELRKSVEEQNFLEDEIGKLEARRKRAEESAGDLGRIEERRETKMHEIEEVSARTEENLDATILYKQQELERTQSIIGRSNEDLEEISQLVSELGETIEEKEKMLEKNEKKDREMNEKFKKMFLERDELQKKVQESNLRISELQNETRGLEEQINYLKVGKARLDAERESFKMALTDYQGVELLKGSFVALEERLTKAREALSRIGTINLRALEVYEKVKEEYDKVYEKVETLGKEKEQIMNIISEIDKKKTRTFMKSFKAVNELFSNNFAKLYNKGVAYLDIENKEDIFAGGVDIVVKLAKGKYFDITSLSGGEKTLVALALLFAIQEHKPYHFYIFDEIDAALDKRNSERLAGLLEQYMKSGQYIVITHNDAIIMNSNLLYGVSMQEGMSKILSLKID